ncbi:MAG: ATP-binding protein [Verrucomicrobiota bacterium]
MSADGMLDLEDERAYILGELEIFNWGPFEGKHRAEFDERGTAIIGSTGSGKTTLVDALMTLLADPPRYNLASTGGHDKNDRTLLSYIRGHGGGANGDQMVRPGKTVTGLAATYQNSNQTIRAMAIFWIDSTSGSQQDLKRRWFIAEDPEQTLDRILRIWEENGARGLMKHGRETPGLRSFESKKAYLAHLRNVFDVSENAFNLLNRAAGLKQLDSIDELFRELVLDDKSAFTRAREVAEEFDTLAAIHKELDDAQRQRESLEPIAEGEKRLTKLNESLNEARQLKQLAPRWYANLGAKLWESESQSLKDQLDSATHERERKQGELNAAADHEKTRQEIYLSLGGSDIEQLESTISAQEELLKTKESKAVEYLAVVHALDLETELSAGHFQRNREQLEHKRPELEESLQRVEEEESDLRSRVRELRRECQRLEDEIREVNARPGSNLPWKHQGFRQDLAGHLGISNEDLPYVAELVEVKAEESGWRGAIERAIGANRLRILVPEEHLREALRWIDGRDNELHVRLQEAQLNEPEKDYFPDSFIYKLNLKSHRLRPALENLLARQDYHCVPDSDTLGGVAHGLTPSGSMSGANGRFDKPDHRRLEEGWMTGFDNRDQLQALARKLIQAKEELATIEPDAQSFLQKKRARETDLRLLDNALALTFDQIDVPGVQSQLNSSKDKLERLLAPDSEASAAKAAYDDAHEATETRRGEIEAIIEEIGGINSRLRDAESSLNACRQRLGDPLTEEETLLAERRFPVPEELTVHTLDDAQRNALEMIDGQIDKQNDAIGNLKQRLGSLMASAQALNEGAYADVGTGLDDIPVYLNELENLIREALPEKRKRFLEYLNKSSDQGVTQLLAYIDQEVSNIEDRILDLNHTLAKVDIRENHYLQLQPQRLNETAIRELERARRHLRDAELKDDEGKSHFRALQNITNILREAGNNRHLVGSRALLDPRYRLQFFVVEVNRDTQKPSTGRTGSHGDSGGEKELMASHILTASLSYALCPSGANRPLYGTIVLDEAFSKTSEARARLIADALEAFGLYPVFVTPNKEISLLKKHTRRAICIQKGTRGSTIAAITWEKLAELQPGS